MLKQSEKGTENLDNPKNNTALLLGLTINTTSQSVLPLLLIFFLSTINVLHLVKEDTHSTLNKTVILVLGRLVL